MAEKKYVYPFEEAYGLGKEILGGKGAGLAEMTHIGVPVPEGFTITTEACTLYYDSGKKIPEFVKEQIFAAVKDLRFPCPWTYYLPCAYACCRQNPYPCCYP